MQFPIYLSSIFIGVKWWLRACCVDRRELCPLAPLGDILINCWCRKSQANSTVESIWRKRTLKFLGRVIYRVICCRILHTTQFILTSSLCHSAAFFSFIKHFCGHVVKSVRNSQTNLQSFSLMLEKSRHFSLAVSLSTSSTQQHSFNRFIIHPILQQTLESQQNSIRMLLFTSFY